MEGEESGTKSATKYAIHPIRLCTLSVYGKSTTMGQHGNIIATGDESFWMQKSCRIRSGNTPTYRWRISQVTPDEYANGIFLICECLTIKKLLFRYEAGLFARSPLPQRENTGSYSQPVSVEWYNKARTILDVYHAKESWRHYHECDINKQI